MTEFHLLRSSGTLSLACSIASSTRRSTPGAQKVSELPGIFLRLSNSSARRRAPVTSPDITPRPQAPSSKPRPCSALVVCENRCGTLVRVGTATAEPDTSRGEKCFSRAHFTRYFLLFSFRIQPTGGDKLFGPRNKRAAANAPFPLIAMETAVSHSAVPCCLIGPMAPTPRAEGWVIID